MIKVLHIVILFFLMIHKISCGDEKEDYTSPPQYDLMNPRIIKLPEFLNEISGIDYYEKDTSLFAINDETGFLYKIKVRNQVQVSIWKLTTKHDFEDVTHVDSNIYFLSSKGSVFQFHFGSRGNVESHEFRIPDNGNNEYEAMFYDSKSKDIKVLCKKCKNVMKGRDMGYIFNPMLQRFSDSLFFINTASVASMLKVPNFSLKASGAAINPLTREIFILSSINKMMVIADAEGTVKAAYSLPRELYKQPEGICFTSWGDLIISNEYAKNGMAELLIIKRRTRNNE